MTGDNKYKWWTGAGIIQRWAGLCSLPDDEWVTLLRGVDPKGQARWEWVRNFEPYWKISLYPLVMQTIFLCGAIVIVMNPTLGASPSRHLAFRTIEYTLHLWPWVWLVIAIISFSSAQYNLMVMRQLTEPNSTKNAPDNVFITTPRAIVYGSIALHSVVWRFCENIYSAIIIVGVLVMVLLQCFQAESNFGEILTVTLSVSTLSALLLIWLFIKYPASRIRDALRLFLIVPIAVFAGYLQSWSIVVVLFGVVFVFSPLVRPWLIPSMLIFIASGFAQSFVSTVEQANVEAPVWLECVYLIAGHLPEAAIILVLWVATGRGLALLGEQLGNFQRVMLFMSFGIGVFILGTPIVLGISTLQEWVIMRLEQGISNVSNSEMLALITIMAGIPTTVTAATVYLHRQLQPDKTRVTRRWWTGSSWKPKA